MAMPTTAAELRAKPVPQGGVDPNVKIPQQILDAGKRSEAIQQAIAGAAEPSVAAQIENGSDQTLRLRRLRQPQRLPWLRRKISRRSRRARRAGSASSRASPGGRTPNSDARAMRLPS